MKAFSKFNNSRLNKRNILFAAALSCLMLAGSLPAFAVPTPQVARILNIQTFTAQCCVLLGPTVHLNEPSTIAPVIVTWSADYADTGTVLFGLSLNGKPCAFFGSGVAPLTTLDPKSTSIFLSSSFQWVVLPADGLVKGSNSFTVCGGGVGGSVTMNIGSNTLTVQISK
jgi:hypothetical protein